MGPRARGATDTAEECETCFAVAASKSFIWLVCMFSGV